MPPGSSLRRRRCHGLASRLGGHGRSPYEQNTQQSPSFGLSLVPQDRQSKKRTHAFCGIAAWLLVRHVGHAMEANSGPAAIAYSGGSDRRLRRLVSAAMLSRATRHGNEDHGGPGTPPRLVRATPGPVALQQQVQRRERLDGKQTRAFRWAHVLPGARGHGAPLIPPTPHDQMGRPQRDPAAQAGAEAPDHRFARRAAVWLSMQPATLGGIPGAAFAKSRRRDQRQQDWRGTFAFRAEHEQAVCDLIRDGRPVVYEGAIDGEHRSVEVRVLSSVPVAGMAFFEGSGEPI